MSIRCAGGLAVRLCRTGLCLSLLGACSNDGEDTGPVDPCADLGSPSLVLGTGAGGEFNTISPGDALGLAAAPQGGFGVPVRARTTGLVADAPVDVLLETEIDGVLTGTFLNEGVQLYCQEDGTGMLWSITVGFDPATYATNDDLLALDGQEVNLVVEADDGQGHTAVGEVLVVISVGR